MKRSKKRRWLVLLTAGLVLAACAAALSLSRPFSTPAGATPPSTASQGSGQNTDLKTLPGKLQTFLVMGVEGWDGEYGRADSMMVASYDPEEQRLAMLSIPRDLWTYIPGHGYDKINHAYAYGGHTLAIDTVEQLLGIDIDHWVAISFEGFTEVIDALGGVTINPPKALHYVDPSDSRMGPDGLVIDIEPGEQIMDGLTALKYSRFRADAEGDLGRMRRQQEVIKAVIQKAASPAIFARAPQLIPAVYNTLGTDMTVGEMLKLAATGRDALSNPLVTGTIEGNAMSLFGIFYFNVDLVAARTAAYQLLVGEAPGEEFLEQAEADNEEYQAALADVMEESEAAAQAAAQEAAEKEAAEKEAAAGKDGESAGEAGGEADGPTPNPEDGAEPDQPKAPAVTVNLVDATGEGIGPEYAERLAAAGFLVESVSETSARIERTMAFARSELTDAESRLRSVIPALMYSQVPDPSAPQDIDLVLGRDILP